MTTSGKEIGASVGLVAGYGSSDDDYSDESFSPSATRPGEYIGGGHRKDKFSTHGHYRNWSVKISDQRKCTHFPYELRLVNIVRGNRTIVSGSENKDREPFT